MAKSGGVHIAVDALGAKQGGSATVLLDVLRALLANDSVEKVTLYSAPPEDRSFDLPESPKLDDRPQPRYEASLALRVLWNSRDLASRARQDGADIVVSMAATMQPNRVMPYVSFIQQSLPFSQEALATLSARQRARMRVVRALTWASCRAARRVYVQTPTMKSWVGDQFDIDSSEFEIVLPEPRTLPIDEVTPIALEPMSRASKGGRLLYVGNSELYKNVELVIRALPLLRTRLPGVTLSATWPPDHPACRRGDVISTGYLREGALGKAYALADALVQPSLVESGPLTMTEAMAVGTPVLVADRCYARDLCRDAALYFDPRDPSHFVDQAHRMLVDAKLRLALVTRGRALVRERAANESYKRMCESIVRAARNA